MVQVDVGHHDTGQVGLYVGTRADNLVAALSVGIIDGVAMLDLPYEEDSRAETDMNVVMTGAGDFVEVQGTAEVAAFTRAELDQLLDLATAGIAEIHAVQRQLLATAPAPRVR